VSNNVLLTAIAPIVGFALGWLAAWLVWRRQAAEVEQHIRTLRASLKGQEMRLLDARVCLQEREANVQCLRARVGYSKETIRGLKARIEEQRRAISWLDLAVRERDGYIKALRAQVGETEPWPGESGASVQEREWGITAIRCLEMAVKERQNRDRGLQVSVRGSEQRLLDLNERLVALVWDLEASSRQLYGGVGRRDGAIRRLEAWIERHTGGGSSIERQ
jgi:hypothetical protein